MGGGMMGGSPLGGMMGSGLMGGSPLGGMMGGGAGGGALNSPIARAALAGIAAMAVKQMMGRR